MTRSPPALALALAAGARGVHAAELAATAAEVAIGKAGTGACHLEELRHRVEARRTVVTLDEAAVLAVGAREAGRRVVLTNGCFDLLHRGHVELLDRARSLGDLLVVGVDDDEAGIERLKGPGRPLQPLADRLAVLAGLSCVDVLVPFSRCDAGGLVRAVRPDVVVKGPGHRPETLPEHPLLLEFGIPLHVVETTSGPSTQKLLERIESHRGGRHLRLVEG